MSRFWKNHLALRAALRSALPVVFAAGEALAQPTVAEPSPALTQEAPPLAPPSLLKVSLDDAVTARSPDGAFSLRLGLQSQFRYELSDHPDKTRDSNFTARQIRPQIRGNVVVPWLRFFIQPELAGTGARMLDFEIDARPIDEIGLRVGQFVTPFSRNYITAVPKLLFPDFSAANDYFRADRDTGAMLSGASWQGVVDYNLGVFNGNGIDKGGNDDDRMLLMARVAVNPLGRMEYTETAALSAQRPARLALGLNGYSGETAHSRTSTDAGGVVKTTVVGTDDNTTLGADLAFAWGRVGLLVEAYYRASSAVNDAKKTDADPDAIKKKALGGFAHASVMVIDRKLEVAGRASFVDPNRDVSNDLLRVFEGLLTFYAHGNNLKLQARYANARNQLAAGAVPADKTVHTLTLQTQLHF